MLTKFGRCLLPVHVNHCRWHQFCTDIDKTGTVGGTISQLFWQSFGKWQKTSCHANFIGKSRTTAYNNIIKKSKHTTHLSLHKLKLPGGTGKQLWRLKLNIDQVNIFYWSWKYFECKPKIIIGFDFWVQYKELCQS